VSPAREAAAMSPASTAQEEAPELRRTPSHAEREGWRRAKPLAGRPRHRRAPHSTAHRLTAAADKVAGCGAVESDRTHPLQRESFTAKMSLGCAVWSRGRRAGERASALPGTMPASTQLRGLFKQSVYASCKAVVNGPLACGGRPAGSLAAAALRASIPDRGGRGLSSQPDPRPDRCCPSRLARLYWLV
jgi:hypothetical protein